MSSSKGSKVSDEALANSPSVETVKDCSTADGGKAPSTKPVRTRLYRGQECPIHKTTRDRTTGAIHDHVEFKRTVINRRTGEQTFALVGKKLRRPGTGEQFQAREEVIEE